ncbi:MAG: hypothetical protein CTY28_09610 [Hyphomicrobium sp.]|nr:MAG: hypothetical protein CTY28_09610 [Hyphomicrobium sp.]
MRTNEAEAIKNYRAAIAAKFPGLSERQVAEMVRRLIDKLEDKWLVEPDWVAMVRNPDLIDSDLNNLQRASPDLCAPPPTPDEVFAAESALRARQKLPPLTPVERLAAIRTLHNATPDERWARSAVVRDKAKALQVTWGELIEGVAPDTAEAEHVAAKVKTLGEALTDTARELAGPEGGARKARAFADSLSYETQNEAKRERLKGSLEHAAAIGRATPKDRLTLARLKAKG